MRKGMIAVVLIAVTLIFALGCGSDNNPTNGGNGGGGGTLPGRLITMNNLAYSPASVTIAVGDTVTWRNDQNIAHTVTSDTGSELASPIMGQGGTYTHVFQTAGTFPYHCTLHLNMTGTVTVQ